MSFFLTEPIDFENHRMTPRENSLRAVRFETPEYIPIGFHVNAACWQSYPQGALHDLMEAHSLLFPGFKRSTEPISPNFGGSSKAGKPYTDDWGCVWETSTDGITGTVTGHPLADWSGFADYKPPDPNVCGGIGPVDWDSNAKRFHKAKAEGQMVHGGLRHGHTFLQLCDIRGYENLMLDMADDEPGLRDLIRMVNDFNLTIVQRQIDLGAEWMSYGDDLGMQRGPMLSPEHFRKYIKPSYQRLMAPALGAGCVVHMHSDGDIRELVDDLVDTGVDVVNLQDLVNGIDWIKEHLTGSVCVDVDVDRQSVSRFGTPDQIDSLIREEVQKLGSKEGGLMMTFGLYPGTPLANVKALMDAMERYMFHYA